MRPLIPLSSNSLTHALNARTHSLPIPHALSLSSKHTIFHTTMEPFLPPSPSPLLWQPSKILMLGAFLRFTFTLVFLAAACASYVGSACACAVRSYIYNTGCRLPARPTRHDETIALQTSKFHTRINILGLAWLGLARFCSMKSRHV